MAADRPLVTPPHQERSRRTEQAIATALMRLLREKPFANITIAEIAAAANVSVGGFYARFKSKAALLHMVELGILDTFERAASEHLDPARFEGTSIEAIARAYTSLLVAHFRTYYVEITQILKYTRARSATEERLRAFNVAVHDRMRALLLARRDAIRGPDVERTINLGLFMAGAACREAVLTRNLTVYPLDVSDDDIAREVGLAFARYVRG